MKIAIAILTLVSACAYAQTPAPPPPPAHHHGPPTPAPNTEVKSPISLSPKESIHTVKLQLAETHVREMNAERQVIISNANSQIDQLNAQIKAEEANEDKEKTEIRQENGWDDDVVYSPAATMPNGAQIPAQWKKLPEKK